MELTSACMNRLVIRFSILQGDLVGWWNRYLREKSICTPNAIAIDFDSLYDELNHIICIFETNNRDPDD